MSKKDEDEKDDKSEKSIKPKFTSRLFAYLLDSILVVFVASLLAFPFIDSKEYDSLIKESSQLLEKVKNKEIDTEEYSVEYMNLEYKMDKSMELVNIMTILVGVIYFVVYPLYHEGQTLGKKFMKIQVVSTKGDLSANQLLFRSFIADFILLRILLVLFVMFASRNVYSICSELFYDAQYAAMIVSIFMIIYSKDGLALHDKLTHTKVIRVN